MTWVAGLTIAIRLNLAGCCARAASDQVVALPIAEMKSRRLIEPPDNRLVDAESLALCGGGASEKGQTIGPDDRARCPLRSIASVWRCPSHFRGRDASYLAPPAQIRTGPIRA